MFSVNIEKVLAMNVLPPLNREEWEGSTDRFFEAQIHRYSSFELFKQFWKLNGEKHGDLGNL